MKPEHPLLEHVQSAEDFKFVLDTLNADLAQAHDHYTLYNNLLAAKEGEFTDAVSQSQTFWSLTYGAHWDAMIYRLCRAYDQKSNALSLLTFLQLIKLRPKFLDNCSGQVPDSELDDALAFVDKRTNRIVKHLMLWRHKVFAHRDAEKTLSQSLADEYPVTHANIELLIQRGFKIVNSVNITVFRASLIQDTHGSEDYIGVLRVLQDSVAAKRAAWKAEMDRLKAENGIDPST